jgi:hypothetical protein
MKTLQNSNFPKKILEVGGTNWRKTYFKRRHKPCRIFIVGSLAHQSRSKMMVSFNRTRCRATAILFLVVAFAVRSSLGIIFSDQIDWLEKLHCHGKNSVYEANFDFFYYILCWNFNFDLLKRHCIFFDRMAINCKFFKLKGTSLRSRQLAQKERKTSTTTPANLVNKREFLLHNSFHIWQGLS